MKLLIDLSFTINNSIVTIYIKFAFNQYLNKKKQKIGILVLIFQTVRFIKKTNGIFKTQNLSSSISSERLKI